VVIDSGYELTIKYNPFIDADVLNMFTVAPKDKVIQWYGRVGRTKPGIVVTPYTEHYYNTFVPVVQDSLLNIANNYEWYFIDMISLKQICQDVEFVSNVQMNYVC